MEEDAVATEGHVADRVIAGHVIAPTLPPRESGRQQEGPRAVLRYAPSGVSLCRRPSHQDVRRYTGCGRQVPRFGHQHLKDRKIIQLPSLAHQTARAKARASRFIGNL